jgi:peptidyl-Lys metalloendopeptidase
VASTNLFNEKATNFKIQDGLSSATIKVKIEGKAGKGKPTPVPTPPPYGNVFDACTTDQQATLITARLDAKAYSSQSNSYLLNHSSGTTRYTTWFGTFESGRYATVTDHFTAIAGAFDTAGITFHCGCKQNYYAYVYPNRPYEIFVCKVFWTAPATGTDSKAGTLIHEMSHFYVVASTSDYVYGQTGAMNLAISDPAKAIMNADNHEYFAENTPFKP